MAASWSVRTRTVVRVLAGGGGEAVMVVRKVAGLKYRMIAPPRAKKGSA